MSRSAPRLARTMRWLPMVVVLGLAGPNIIGLSPAVTVLAQPDSGDQQPADMATPTADDSTPSVEEAPAGDVMPAPATDESSPAVEQTPGGAAMPTTDETLPATDGTPAAPTQDGDIRLCVEVTRAPDGSLNVVTQPCPPDSP
jgi:hypothetical protein